jgi:outer membrane protein OmpA-like peptidoglycan-associated protein
MPDNQAKQSTRIKRLRKAGLIAAGLFVLYLIIGFWVLPSLIKPELEENLSGLLGRKVTIGAIKLNALVLSATVSNLTLYEIDGQAFAGFEELYANAQLASIFKWAVVVREIRVQSPFGMLKLLPDNKLNIDDIIAKLSEPKPEAEKENGLPRAIVEKFQVIDGKITLDNLTGKEAIHEEIAPISFTLENLSTLADRQGEYRFVGVGPFGGQFAIDGKISVTPVRIQGRYDITGIKLNHYWEHFKDLFAFRIVSGTAAVNGSFAVEIIDNQLNTRITSGAFELNQFKLVEKGKQEVLIALPTLSVQGVAADLQARKAVVDRIFTANAAFKSWVAADGSSELQRLLPKDIDETKATRETANPPRQPAESAPWQVAVKQIEIEDWGLTVDAEVGEETLRETAIIHTLKVENLSTAADQQGTYTFDASGPSGGSYRLNGMLTINPVSSRGRYAITNVKLNHIWKHIKDHVAFQIADGSTGASGDFTVALSQDDRRVRLENGTFQLNGFKLVEKGRDDVLIAIPDLKAQDIGVDLQARKIDVASVQAADANIKSWLAADGTFALRELLLPNRGASKEVAAEDDPAAEKAPSQPWIATISKIEMRNGGLAFEDRTLTNTAKLALDNIDVVVENLTNQKDAKANFDIAMRINQAGRVNAKGAMGIDPPRADVKVVAAKIALKPFQPYVDEAVKAQIATGTTSSQGRIRYRGQDAQPQIRLDGEFSIDDLKIQDRLQTGDFISLAQFRAGGIALELLPNKLKASEILIDRPHGRIAIDEAGVVNVIEAFAAPVAKQAEKGKENLLQRLVNLLILQFRGPIPMRVDRIRLDRFTMDFTDASISPTFDTRVEISEGVVRGLSSDPSAHADFKLNGSIDRTATIQGAGKMNPMNALRYSKVDLSLKDLALEPLSPYSGKFIGYRIDRGSLHTELSYRVEEDAVNGNNIIYIDHLNLGPKVDSPDAVNLPIKLAVALLKDRNGRITLQMPVIGNVRDPKFDSATAIKSALTRTVKDASSDPFATIREIDGFKGDDLRVVGFDFGVAALQEPETQKLDALAKYLQAKNTLILVIAGTADRQMDGAVLMGTLPAENDSSDKTPSDSAAGETVDDEHLIELAQSRAEKVSAYLIEQAGIDARRVKLKPAQIKPAPDGERASVEFSLSVE